MRAMVLQRSCQPLQLEERPIPTPGSQQLLINVLACGVCRPICTCWMASCPKRDGRGDITRFALNDANQALERLRTGQFTGAIVLIP